MTHLKEHVEAAARAIEAYDPANASHCQTLEAILTILGTSLEKTARLTEGAEGYRAQRRMAVAQVGICMVNTADRLRETQHLRVLERSAA